MGGREGKEEARPVKMAVTAINLNNSQNSIAKRKVGKKLEDGVKSTGSLSNLVPRVSPLPVPWSEEEERPWERGW